MIHNYPTRMRKKFNGDAQLKKCEIGLTVNFFMYYFVVNDVENGTRSEIKKILLCRGSFFAPNTTEAEASDLSNQLAPQEVGREINLYRVSLRYRPFFECRVIQANGYGIYTSWEPRRIGEIAEEAQRQALLDEVERIQQNPLVDVEDQVMDIQIDEEDNVIYLNLTADRISRRAA